MSAQLSPSPKQAFLFNGDPAVGCQLFTYAAGTTNKITTYVDRAGATPNTNPIILDGRGEANIWLVPGTFYKFTLAPPTDTDPPTAPIWTVDDISLQSPADLGELPGPYPDDEEAAANGVPLFALYRNASVVQQRIA